MREQPVAYLCYKSLEILERVFVVLETSRVHLRSRAPSGEYRSLAGGDRGVIARFLQLCWSAVTERSCLFLFISQYFCILL